MDAKNHIVIYNQPFEKRTRRERVGITNLPGRGETPLGLENPLVGELRDIAGVKVTHPSHHQPKAIREVGGGPEVGVELAWETPSDAIPASISPSELEII